MLEEQLFDSLPDKFQISQRIYGNEELGKRASEFFEPGQPGRVEKLIPPAHVICETKNCGLDRGYGIARTASHGKMMIRYRVHLGQDILGTKGGFRLAQVDQETIHIAKGRRAHHISLRPFQDGYMAETSGSEHRTGLSGYVTEDTVIEQVRQLVD